MPHRLLIVPVIACTFFVAGCGAESASPVVTEPTLSSNGRVCLAYETAQNKLGFLLASARNGRMDGAVSAAAKPFVEAMHTAADQASGKLHNHLMQAVNAVPTDPALLSAPAGNALAVRHRDANQEVKADCAAEGQNITPMDLGALQH